MVVMPASPDGSRRDLDVLHGDAQRPFAAQEHDQIGDLLGCKQTTLWNVVVDRLLKNRLEIPDGVNLSLERAAQQGRIDPTRAHQITRHTIGRTFGAEPKINNCNNTIISLSIPHREPETCRFHSPGATEEGERIMPSARLTQRRVDTLKPRSRAYDVRDPGLKGFGVRIMPSGSKRYFLHSQSDGKRIWHAIGDAGAIILDDARSRARALLAARQDGNADNPDTRDVIPFETVADEVFQRYGRRWKPRTLAVNLGYYRNQILPWFRGKPISDITRRDVLQWHASLHGVPFAADRSAPILSVIFKQAETYGYRPEGSNPCTGIKRYRRGGRERFLSAEEMRRLSKVLDRHQDRHPMETSILRLLLLTGCRKSEILTLQMVRVPRGKALSLGQQDRAAHGLAVVGRAQGSG